MTSIGILGAGRVGTRPAGGLAAAGHQVVLGSRSPEERTAAPAEDVGSPASPTPASGPQPAPRTS
ncbi:NAD(P)-binding domain-containing protein [Streptomyces sp. NPDC088766]|uniref:NAD(P)-binding domain-containing protein n=1 Tax=Streptomyces sp. NPDC088766 TaxID=3365893 RepID=UPI00380EB0B6